MKRKTALLLAAVMVSGSLLSACGGSGDASKGAGESASQATEGGASGQNIAVEVGPDPETIDPHLNSAIDGSNVIVHAFETLMVTDEEGKIAPGQAESYDVSDDGLTYTFHLREGLKWSDGTPLTANDFVYTWKRFVNPETAAPYAYDMMGMVKGYDEAAAGDVDKLAVSAADDTTLVVELAYPCVYFDKIITHPSTSPVQQATVEANGDQWTLNPETYVGNGALKMSEWVPGSHITFVKNENYWNADRVKLESLKFVLMEDVNAAYSAYKTGEVHMIKDVPTEEIPALRDQEDFYLDPIMGTYYLSFNTQKEPFTDPKVRMALSLAIDRDYVGNVVMQGIYSPAGNFVGPGISDVEAGSSFEEVSRQNNGGKDYFDLENFDAQLAKAKELMAEAGYADGAGFPVIEYMTNDASYHKPLAEYLQSAWKELGVNMDIKILEWSTFTPTRRNGDFQIARNGWSCDYDDPLTLLNLLETKNGNNDGKYSNEKVDALLQEAKETSDLDLHYQKLHEAEKAMLDDAAMAPVAYYNDFWLQNPKLKGSWHSANGYWLFMFAYMEE